MKQYNNYSRCLLLLAASFLYATQLSQAQTTHLQQIKEVHAGHTDTQYARQSITATNVIAGQATYQAGDIVTLGEGFEVKAGATFHAYTDKNHQKNKVSAQRKEENNRIQLFPNPSGGIFTLRLSDQTTTQNEVKILNSQGKEISSLKNLTVGTTHPIDLSTQKKGVYLFKVITEQGIKIKKVILEK